MTYKLLWTATLLMGIASLILFCIDLSLPTFLAAAACGVACAITFTGAWSGR